jgi:hypothetical protein
MLPLFNMSKPHSPSAGDCFRLPILSTKTKSEDWLLLKPGLYWVSGDNSKSSLYFYGVSAHRCPDRAIYELSQMSQFDSSELVNHIFRVIERYENKPRTISNRSRETTPVNAESGDTVESSKGSKDRTPGFPDQEAESLSKCSELDASCEIADCRF